MKRYKLTIEYDGTPYHGWQKQPGLPTIQEELEKAIQAFTQEEVEVYGSGRTDAGVHAIGQVAHTDFEKDMTPYAIREAMNFYLRKKAIGIKKVVAVSEDFHARFSAQERTYVYKILCRETPLVLDKNRAWHVYKKLDLEKMRAGAYLLTGTHDFSSFRAADCQSKSPVKTIKEIRIEEDEALEGFSFHVRARSFLHHQVRNMVGALKMLGEEKWTLNDLQAALEAKDRNEGGVMAPAEGLYLASILY